MAIKQISWENKTGIQNDPSVARKNKVTDEDMNEIKEAINNNAHELETNLRDIQVDSEELTQRVYDVEDDCDTLKDEMLHLQQYELKELDELIPKLKNALINAETEESKSIHVEDASTIGQLEVLGNQEQDGEPSPENEVPVICLGSNKNLLNTSLILETTKGGITSKLNPDGSITFNGTCTTDNNVFGFYIEGSTKFTFNAIKNKTTISAFYVSGNVTNEGILFRINNSSYSGGSIDLKNLPKEKIMTHVFYEESEEVFCDIRFDKNVVLDNFTIKVKVANTLEEALTYSPYGQGSTLISKINKNLFDKNNANILKAYIGQISKKITAGTYHRTIFLKVNSGDTYTIKKYVGNGLIVGQLKELPKIEDVVDNFISTKSETPSITTKISDGYNYLVACIVNNEDNTEDNTEDKILNSIQIEKGNVATNYVEHQQTDYLLYIQQEMLKGDYFVKESDGWKEVHSYPKKIFDGTEAWNLESLSQGNNFYTNIPDALGDTTVPVYSNCFMYYNGFLEKNYSCRISDSKNLNLRCSEKNTVEEFKQMLADKYNAGNPVYAFYKSATPTKLPCTEEQSAVLEELSNMDLFEGVNNIITAEDVALLKLNYIADTKTYIDNKLNIINQQILEIAGGNG